MEPKSEPERGAPSMGPKTGLRDYDDVGTVNGCTTANVSSQFHSNMKDFLQFYP